MARRALLPIFSRTDFFLFSVSKSHLIRDVCLPSTVWVLRLCHRSRGKIYIVRQSVRIFFTVSGVFFVSDFPSPPLAEAGCHLFSSCVFTCFSVRCLICLSLLSPIWGVGLLPVGQPAPCMVKAILCPLHPDPTFTLFISSVFKETFPVCPPSFFSWARSALKYFMGIIRLLIPLFRLSLSLQTVIFCIVSSVLEFYCILQADAIKRIILFPVININVLWVRLFSSFYIMEFMEYTHRSGHVLEWSR